MDYVWAFIIGGGLCVIGQILMDTTTLTTPRVLVIFVVSGVVLQALGLYQPLVDLAGSGATVPLTGFGYNLAKGAIDGAKNAAILAAKILAASDDALLQKLKDYTTGQKEAVKAKAAKLDEVGYEAYLASK